MNAGHNLSIRRTASGYRVECVCGWVSEANSSRNYAAQRYVDHVHSQSSYKKVGEPTSAAGA